MLTLCAPIWYPRFSVIVSVIWYDDMMFSYSLRFYYYCSWICIDVVYYVYERLRCAFFCFSMLGVSFYLMRSKTFVKSMKHVYAWWLYYIAFSINCLTIIIASVDPLFLLYPWCSSGTCILFCRLSLMSAVKTFATQSSNVILYSVLGFCGRPFYR